MWTMPDSFSKLHDQQALQDVAKNWGTSVVSESWAGDNDLGQISFDWKTNTFTRTYNNLTRDDLQRGIYNALCMLLFDDANELWGHTTDILGVRYTANPAEEDTNIGGTYLGVQYAYNLSDTPSNYVGSNYIHAGGFHFNSVSDPNDDYTKNAGVVENNPDSKVNQAPYTTEIAIPSDSDAAKEAQAKLDAAKSDLEDVQTKLNDAKSAQNDAQTKLDDAKHAEDVAEAKYKTAVASQKTAQDNLKQYQDKLAQDTQTLNNMKDTQSLVDAKRKALADAKTELGFAQLDLQKAQKTQDEAQNNKDAADSKVESAKQAVTDAQSALDTAKDNLTKAQDHLANVKAVAKAQAQAEANDNGYHADGTQVVDKDNQPVNGWKVDPANAEAINNAQNALNDAKADQTKAQDAAKTADEAVDAAQAKVTSAQSKVQSAENGVQDATKALNAAKQAQTNTTTPSVTDPASYGLTVTATDAAKAAAAKLNAGTDWNDLTDSERAAIVNGITISYTPTESQKQDKIADVNPNGNDDTLAHMLNETTDAQLIDATNFVAAGINGIRQALGLNTGSVYVNSNMQAAAKAANQAYLDGMSKGQTSINLNDATKPYGLTNLAFNVEASTNPENPTSDYKFVHQYNVNGTQVATPAEFLSMAHLDEALSTMLPSLMHADTTTNARMLSQVLGLKYGKAVNGNSYVSVPKTTDLGNNTVQVYLATPQSITDNSKFTSATNYGTGDATPDTSAVDAAQTKLDEANTALTQAKADLTTAQSGLTDAKAAQTKAQDALTTANNAVKTAETNYTNSYKDAKLVSPEGIVVTPGAAVETPKTDDDNKSDTPTKGDDSKTDTPAKDDSNKGNNQGSDVTTPSTPAKDDANKGSDDKTPETPVTPTDSDKKDDSQGSDVTKPSTPAKDDTNKGSDDKTPETPVNHTDSDKKDNSQSQPAKSDDSEDNTKSDVNTDDHVASQTVSVDNKGNVKLTETNTQSSSYLMTNSNAISTTSNMKRSNLNNSQLPETGNNHQSNLVIAGLLTAGLAMFGLASRKRRY